MTDLPLEISCDEARSRLASDEKPLLVDCRETDEYARVAIADAKLLPMSELAQRYQELAGNEEKPLIVYCHHGGRSAQVTAWLRKQGFAQAQSMAGGIDVFEPGMERY